MNSAVSKLEALSRLLPIFRLAIPLLLVEQEIVQKPHLLTKSLWEKDEWTSIDPDQLQEWETTQLRPFAGTKDISYAVFCPLNQCILQLACQFFRDLSSVYQVRNGVLQYLPFSLFASDRFSFIYTARCFFCKPVF